MFIVSNRVNSITVWSESDLLLERYFAFLGLNKVFQFQNLRKIFSSSEMEAINFPLPNCILRRSMCLPT